MVISTLLKVANVKVVIGRPWQNVTEIQQKSYTWCGCLLRALKMFNALIGQVRLLLDTLQRVSVRILSLENSRAWVSDK